MMKIRSKQKQREGAQFEQRRNCLVWKGSFQQLPDESIVNYRSRIPVNYEGGMVTLSLLAGLVTHPVVYMSQLKHFAGIYPIITMDGRGFWASCGASTPETYLADFTKDFLKVLDIERVDRTVIVGHSMSGAIAMMCYHADPSRIAGLVLVAPAYSDPRMLSPFLKYNIRLKRNIDTFARFFGQAGIANAMAHVLSKTGFAVAGLQHSIMPLLAAEPENIEHFHKLIKNIYRADMRTVSIALQALFGLDDVLLNMASEIRVPVLIIAGEQDPLIPPKSMLPLHDVLPDSELLVFPGVKHFPILNSSDRFNYELGNFLDRINTSPGTGQAPI